jgi:uncharacterized membrane protein YbhN (UPF0104 family)
MKARNNLMNILVAAAIVLSLALIYNGVNRYSLTEIMQSLGSIPLRHLLLSVVFTIASYIALTGFDVLGLLYAGKPLPYGKTALTSFVSLSIGHNVGLAALSSGAIRYRFYSRWGLGVEDVAKVVLFSGITVAIGLLSLCSLAMLFRSDSAARIIGLSPYQVWLLGLAAVLAIGVYLVLCWRLRLPLRVRKWTFKLPSLRLATGQLVVGTLNFALIAASLQQLLLAYQKVSYWDVATAYSLANGAVIASHIPGGLGVLEASTQFLLPQAATIGAVIAFRCVYFFLPLPLGMVLFALSEREFRRSSGTARSFAG